MEIYSYAPWGFQGHLVRVEVDLHRGIPGLEIVGLPGNAVREARDRIRIAFGHSGFVFPQDRILINLAPADIPKTGSGYDLALALALLQASGQWQGEGSLLALGELSLDGRLRRVDGTLAAAARAGEAGLDAVALPVEASSEASSAGVPAYRGATLRELVQHLNSGCPNKHNSAEATEFDPPGPFLLRGQPQIVRALQVSAAGGHPLLLFGPPGGGKTLAARTLEHLMPPATAELTLESSRIWSLAGKLAQEQGVLSARPFREPHHSATSEGILGGGPHLGPGEISLAHNGVLFLDEAPEFSPRLLQALREPLESGQIQVVRAGRSVWYPSRFLLVMTANGCPCGQTGREKGTCFCGSQSVRRYWDRIGTALLDRVDLRVFVTPASGALQESAPTWSEVRSPILGAVQRQRKRGQSPGESNASLGFERLRQLCPIPLAAWNLATAWGIREDWSTRGLQAVVKVALTLADLENSPVTPAHIEAAAGLRKPSGGEPWSA